MPGDKIINGGTITCGTYGVTPGRSGGNVKITGGGKVTEMLIWDGTNTLKKKDTNGISVTELSVDDIVDNIDTDGLTLDRIRTIMNES